MPTKMEAEPEDLLHAVSNIVVSKRKPETFEQPPVLSLISNRILMPNAISSVPFQVEKAMKNDAWNNHSPAQGTRQPSVCRPEVVDRAHGQEGGELTAIYCLNQGRNQCTPAYAVLTAAAVKSGQGECTDERAKMREAWQQYGGAKIKFGPVANWDPVENCQKTATNIFDDAKMIPKPYLMALSRSRSERYSTRYASPAHIGELQHGTCSSMK